MSERYQAYLASREWALKREAVRERSGGVCERCRHAPQQAVHHLTYAHLYDEPLEDLMAICDPCHEFLSAKSDIDPAAVSVGRSDINLIISIERETRCELCGADPLGDYVRCAICKRAACGDCWVRRGKSICCLDHAEGA